MVDWFDPRQLARTGARTVLTHVFGDFFDRRELQAALATPEEHTYHAEEDGTFWFDYVADLGDGFNPTYTVARTLARRQLSLDLAGQSYHLPRGRILVMGGDQVYPVASLRTFEDRLIGPFRSALPCEEKDRVPHLFALPGNHDWYDGLTSFLRVFVQQGWIGGWKTRQQRSYFAARLPHDVWIWGIDSRTESRLDKPQLDYFRRVAAEHEIRGHRIILCAAEPGWVYEKLGGSHRPKTRAFQNLAYFEKSIIDAHGARLLLTIAGDLHHYSRYEEAGGARQKITSGGGGATLFPTHVLPEVLALPQIADGTVADVDFERRAVFPSRKASASTPRGALKLPVKSPSFSITLGGLLLAAAWLLQSSSLKGGGNLFSALAELEPLGGSIVSAMEALISVTLFSPGAAGLLLIVVTGWMFFTGLSAWYAGLTHGILQIFLGFSIIWLSAYVSTALFPGADLIQVLSFSFLVVAPGGLMSAFLVGLYLYAVHRLLGLHANEVLASQSYEDFKNFIRVCVEADAVTVFPIGFERVCRSWRLNTDPGAAPGDPWFEPAPGSAIEPRLIEEPIRIPLRARPPVRSASSAEEPLV
jgi:hypothetical protein